MRPESPYRCVAPAQLKRVAEGVGTGDLLPEGVNELLPETN